jgi:isovaleryl-CoA dehydrogenase
MKDLFNPSSDHKSLRDMLRQFAESELEPQAIEFDRAERFNIDLFRRLGKELGVLGVTVPEQWGGSEFDSTAAVIVHEELSAIDPAFCLSYLAHSMLFANNLALNGNDIQRARYLPGACNGDLIGGMCMSEPNAGTDVLGMGTQAKEVDGGYLINGAKMWITNGAIDDDTLGDVFLVYVRFEGDPRNQLSMLIVEKGDPGFSLGQRIKDKLGMRASSTAELVFEDCFVPHDRLVGKRGEAMLHMMRNLELERLTLAAMSLGIARRSIEVMNQYASDRVTFGKPLRSYGQIQAMIADSYAEYMAGRSYVYQVASQLSLNSHGNRLDSDGVKLYCARMAKQVADRAIQVLGGYGYVGEYHVERLWRDARLLEIGGGTNEAHQKNMTRDLARISVLK